MINENKVKAYTYKGYSPNLISFSDRKDWLEKRRLGIGGSDASAICGVNKWKTAYQVWIEKTQNVPESESNFKMMFGQEVEQGVINLFQRLHPEYEVWKPSGILQHPEYPYLLVSLDACLDSKIKVGDWLVLEIKTTSENNKKYWKELPEGYYLQVQHELLVSGFEEAILYACFGNESAEIFHISRNEELIEKMLKIYEYFWNENVIKRIPPPVNAQKMKMEDLNTIFKPQKECKLLKLHPLFEHSIKNYIELNDKINELTKEREFFEKEIKAEMKESTIATCGGYNIVWDYGRKTLQKDQLKKDHPELFAKYEVEETKKVFKLDLFKEEQEEIYTDFLGGKERTKFEIKKG